MQKDHVIPLSILAGCGIIAAGLYFGLRAQSPQVAPAPAAPPGSAFATAADPPPPPRSAPPPPLALPPTVSLAPTSPAELQATAEKAATAALLAEKKKTFLPKCWLPALQKEPRPAVAKYTLSMMFDAQGKEIGRALSEDRSALRSDVGRCLQDLPMGLQLEPPPGAPVSVTIPLEFP
jgi:hypothetical protein